MERYIIIVERRPESREYEARAEWGEDEMTTAVGFTLMDVVRNLVVAIRARREAAWLGASAQ